MNWSQALDALKAGNRIQRSGWNGKGMFLVMIASSEWTMSNWHANGFERLPWIGMKTADDHFVPWLASQTDILAEDWERA